MLPREVQTEHWPDRATFDFPTRPIGPLRLIGLIPMVFALVFAWMPTRFMLDFLHRGSHGGGNGLHLIPVVFFLIFAAASLMPFVMGLFIVAGRTRLVVGRDRVTATQIAGPLRWSRTTRFADIERLEVAATLARPDNHSAIPALGKLGALAATLRQGKKAVLLVGYPRDWLEGMAAELSGLMQLQGNTVTVKQVAAVAPGDSAGMEPVLEKPADSLANLVETSDGIELAVPSRGLWKESSGALLFGFLWCVVLCVITAGFVFGSHKSGTRGSLGPLGVALLVAAFWGIGLGMVVAGIHLGTRHWTLSANRRRLQVRLQSALRAREWQWPASEISDIKSGNSNVTVNDRRLLQLQIVLRTGGQTGLLTGREPTELAWIATVLKRVLQLAAAAPASGSPDEPN